MFDIITGVSTLIFIIALIFLAYALGRKKVADEFFSQLIEIKKQDDAIIKIKDNNYLKIEKKYNELLDDYNDYLKDKKSCINCKFPKDGWEKCPKLRNVKNKSWWDNTGRSTYCNGFTDK